MGPHFMSLLSIWVLYSNVSYIYHISCLEEIILFQLISNLFQTCFKLVSNLFQTCFKLVSNLFQTCFKLVSNLFQTCFKLVSNLFQTCFKLVSLLCFPWPSSPSITIHPAKPLFTSCPTSAYFRHQHPFGRTVLHMPKPTQYSLICSTG